MEGHGTWTAAWVPIDELTTPREGETYIDRCWVVNPEKTAVLFVKTLGMSTFAPQCNRDERVTGMVLAKMYEGCETLVIPVAYLGRVPDDHGNFQTFPKPEHIEEYP